MSPYDAPLSALLEHVEDLGTWIGIWENRAEPDAQGRRCASDAVDAIDAMLGHLYGVRAQLVSEIRRSDDASAARVDEMLAQRRGEAGLGRPPEHDPSARQAAACRALGCPRNVRATGGVLAGETPNGVRREDGQDEPGTARAEDR